MKISKAIFAVDGNPQYQDLWPIVSEVCLKKLEITPVLFNITDHESDFIEDEFGLVKNVKSIDGIDTGRQSQIIRMWATKYFPDEVCIISDIDMMMFNKEYFISQVSNFSNNDLVIYCSDAYDSSRPECLGIYSNRYLLTYNAATGKTFDKILNTDCDFESYINRVLSSGFPDFDSDELYFTQCVNSNNHGANVIKLVRGYYTKFQCPRRIDRVSDSHFNLYDDELLYQNHYVDCHLARPYSKYKNEIDQLKNKILSIGKREVYLIGCHIDNLKKLSYLSELVSTLKENNKDFVIVSHTMIPESIIKESVGFVYDSINPKFKNWELLNKEKYKIYTDSFSIESPYILWGRNDYYHVGVIRLLINGINYIKNLDYDIVHWIEYDALPLFEEEERNKFRLEKYDFIFYGIGSRFSFNKKKVNTDFLSRTNDKILDGLKRNNYTAEILIFNELISGEKLTFDVSGKSEFWGKNSNNFDEKTIDWSLFENGEYVYIFVKNYKTKKKIIIELENGSYKKMDLECDYWYTNLLFSKQDIQNIKIYLDGEIFEYLELRENKLYEQVVKSVIINFV
jgi:hypothetical protein